MRSTPPLFAPRLDWLILLVSVGFSLTLLFFGKGKAASAVKREVGGIVAYLGKPVVSVRRTFDMLKEVEALRTQTETLSRENNELRDAMLENQRLRGMLDFRARSLLPMTTAEVIGFPGLQIGGRIILDKGRAQGIQINSAVLSPEGLVGKVTDVSQFTSLVQTVQGNAYGVSVMIERSRVGGILRWLKPGEWTILGLSTGEDVRPGDLVVTTGAGFVFPKGIRVGVVTKVGGQTDPTAGWCRVRPFVRFESLEEVFVVTLQTKPDPRADSLMMEGQP
jgi:rod shape-determining protein MreC